MRWDGAAEAEALDRARHLPVAAGGAATGPAENWTAAIEGEASGNQGQAAFQYLRRHYDRYAEEIEAVTGERLDNPVWEFEDIFIPDPARLMGQFGFSDVPQEPLDAFHERVEALAADHPELTALSKEDVWQRIAEDYHGAVRREQAVESRATVLGEVAGSVASFASFATDPLNVVSIFAPVAKTRTLWQMAMAEGAISGAVEGATIPGINRFRENIGEDPLTLGEGAKQVAAGFAFGAAGSVAFALTGRGATKAIDAIKARGGRIDPVVESAAKRHERALDASPFEPTRQGDAEHFARMDAARQYIETGKPMDFPDVPDRTGVTVRQDLVPAEEIRAAIEADLPPLDNLYGLLRDLRQKPDRLAPVADELRNVNARMTVAQGFPAAIRVDRNAFEAEMAGVSPETRTAVWSRFDTFLSEPAELLQMEGRQFLRIRRIDGDPEGRYLVAEFQRKGRKNQYAQLDYVRTAAREQIDAYRAAAVQRPDVDRVRARTMLEGRAPEGQIDARAEARLGDLPEGVTMPDRAPEPDAETGIAIPENRNAQAAPTGTVKPKPTPRQQRIAEARAEASELRAELAGLEARLKPDDPPEMQRAATALRERIDRLDAQTNRLAEIDEQASLAGEADVIEPLLAVRLDGPPLPREQTIEVLNASMDPATGDGAMLDRMLAVEDVTISAPVHDASGKKIIGAREASAREALAAIQEDEMALAAYRDCARLA